MALRTYYLKTVGRNKLFSAMRDGLMGMSLVVLLAEYGPVAALGALPLINQLSELVSALTTKKVIGIVEQHIRTAFMASGVSELLFLAGCSLVYTNPKYIVVLLVMNVLCRLLPIGANTLTDKMQLEFFGGAIYTETLMHWRAAVNIKTTCIRVGFGFVGVLLYQTLGQVDAARVLILATGLTGVIDLLLSIKEYSATQELLTLRGK